MGSAPFTDRQCKEILLSSHCWEETEDGKYINSTWGTEDTFDNAVERTLFEMKKLVREEGLESYRKRDIRIPEGPGPEVYRVLLPEN